MPSVDRAPRWEFHNYAPWVNVVLGFLVFVTRYLPPHGPHAMHWNLFLTGLAIMFSALAATIAHDDAAHNYWSAINVAAGIWLVASRELFPTSTQIADIQTVLGVAIVVVAAVALAVEIAGHRRASRARWL